MTAPVISAIIAGVGVIAGLAMLYFRIQQEKRDQERHAIEVARERDRQGDLEARRLQEVAAQDAARQREAAGTLTASLNFYHHMGQGVFVKIVVENTRTTSDRITGVHLLQPPKTDWRVLVPTLAPGVAINPQAWQQWTHSFPLDVPAGTTLVFWVSGYVPLGIIENRSEVVIGQMFDFKILTALSGEKAVRAPLEHLPAP